ncbi:hypothetical protein ATOP_15920 [Granulimonas faecalis]|uniref:Uncharacterized protein n=1 Tax=Granulimonas faecalis TaxID=2894155 RepID=A0AAV5B4F0_9ACTN|nr:hypothetical protein ATOP_15920 [Granulimonas faecalis]
MRNLGLDRIRTPFRRKSGSKKSERTRKGHHAYCGKELVDNGYRRAEGLTQLLCGKCHKRGTLGSGASRRRALGPSRARRHGRVDRAILPSNDCDASSGNGDALRTEKGEGTPAFVNPRIYERRRRGKPKAHGAREIVSRSQSRLGAAGTQQEDRDEQNRRHEGRNGDIRGNREGPPAASRAVATVMPAPSRENAPKAKAGTSREQATTAAICTGESRTASHDAAPPQRGTTSQAAKNAPARYRGTRRVTTWTHSEMGKLMEKR